MSGQGLVDNPCAQIDIVVLQSLAMSLGLYDPYGDPETTSLVKGGGRCSPVSSRLATSTVERGIPGKVISGRLTGKTQHRHSRASHHVENAEP
jgi:hypothetical protein